MKKKTEWKRVVDNKMRGAYGETNYDTQTIRVNKKKHKKDEELLLDTIVHEEQHRIHPKMKEKNVRLRARQMIAHMAKKRKKKLYNLYA